MKNPFGALALITGICFGAATGCQTTAPEAAPDEEATSPVTSEVQINSENLNRVTDAEWQLESMIADGQSAELTAGSEITLSISAEGSVSGLASVNRYNGGFLFAEQGEIQWGGGFATTRMAGPPVLMDQEQKYLAALEQTTSMTLQASTLNLNNSGGTSLLRFSRKEQD